MDYSPWGRKELDVTITYFIIRKVLLILSFFSGILAAIINEKTALPVIEYLLIEHQPFLCDSFRSQLFICITT